MWSQCQSSCVLVAGDVLHALMFTGAFFLFLQVKHPSKEEVNAELYYRGLRTRSALLHRFHGIPILEFLPFVPRKEQEINMFQRLCIVYTLKQQQITRLDSAKASWRQWLNDLYSAIVLRADRVMVVLRRWLDFLTGIYDRPQEEEQSQEVRCGWILVEEPYPKDKALSMYQINLKLTTCNLQLALVC